MVRICLATLCLSAPLFGEEAPRNFSHEAAYSGPELQGQVYLCKSDRVASAGFRRDPPTGTIKETYEVSQQKNMTTWRITLKGSQAEVAAFTGATRTLETPQLFSATRQANFVQLTQIDSRPSTQVISIDVSNSSFVYTGNDLSQLMNKDKYLCGLVSFVLLS